MPRTHSWPSIGSGQGGYFEGGLLAASGLTAGGAGLGSSEPARGWVVASPETPACAIIHVEANAAVVDLLVEEDVAKRLSACWQQVRRYGRTLAVALWSPAWLASHALGAPASPKSPYVSPLPLVLSAFLMASLLRTVVEIVVGVDAPFFSDLDYKARQEALGEALGVVGKVIPSQLHPVSLLSGLNFLAILLATTLWARLVRGSTRCFWIEFSSLAYLTPLALLADIVDYAVVNLAFRVIGGSALGFAGFLLVVVFGTKALLYGVVLGAGNRIYGGSMARRTIHAAGFIIVVPSLVCVLEAASFLLPVTVSAYRVLSKAEAGQERLMAGDHQGAEALLNDAIRTDPTSYWSGGARLRLVSVHARYIIAALPHVSRDSGLRERLGRLLTLGNASPYRHAPGHSGSGRSADVNPSSLVELRDAILADYLASGDVPVTNSELDDALKACSPTSEGCVGLSTRSVGTPAERRHLFHEVYRAQALAGEPDPSDSIRYLQFLADLPIRLELRWVRYRALNLMRDGETLATLDDADRLGHTERDGLVAANREIRDKGLKYPHLELPDDRIEALPVRDLGFHLRQAYLGYLDAEVKSLQASAVCRESPRLQQHVGSIREILDSTARDAMYRRPPLPDPLVEDLLRLVDSWK